MAVKLHWELNWLPWTVKRVGGGGVDKGTSQQEIQLCLKLCSVLISNWNVLLLFHVLTMTNLPPALTGKSLVSCSKKKKKNLWMPLSKPFLWLGLKLWRLLSTLCSQNRCIHRNFFFLFKNLNWIERLKALFATYAECINVKCFAQSSSNQPQHKSNTCVRVCERESWKQRENYSHTNNQ